jgi:hypothetical protein
LARLNLGARVMKPTHSAEENHRQQETCSGHQPVRVQSTTTPQDALPSSNSSGTRAVPV